MKKFLLTVLAFVCVSIGAWAGTLSGTGISGTYSDGVQQIRVTQPGALAAWVAEHKNDAQQALGTESGITSLKIIGSLNAADFAALNAAEYGAFSRFPKVDMTQVTLSEGATATDACSVNFGPGSFTNNGSSVSGTGATFIRMPNSMTDEASVAAMKTMQQNGKNSSVKVVGAFDNSNSNWPKLGMCSFEVNHVTDFLNQMSIPTVGKQATEIAVKEVRMAGLYGDKDLVNNSTPNFGYKGGAIWDFTGANFANCTVSAPQVITTPTYYNYDNPFENGSKYSTSGTTYNTNAFYYFSEYKNTVLEIKLPDVNMTSLPTGCLEHLGSMNKENYQLLHPDVTDAQFNEMFTVSKDDGTIQAAGYASIESLVIPDCYVDLDYDCAKWAHVSHVYIGSGVKHIHGGAFYNCDMLEDLDFGAGLSDCYIGDQAFKQCPKMKHIALSEGIVSIGAWAFHLSKHLESIRLPETLINIGNGAFDNCLALNSIVIPRNVEKIGQKAFNLCPLTDIYLTTTDPSRIPYIWTVGTSFGTKDAKSTFYSPDFDGNNGIPNNAGDHPAMTWEEAADYYFIHANGIPVLHYPEQLAEKVRESISDTYLGETTDGFRIPYQDDRGKRDNIPGADLGSVGEGKFSQDGWAQLMLMKGYKVDGPNPNVYTKEYDDVWYTMCFPFDLTDEQLASAFNETFNIVDFSAVELNQEEKTLTLHFNNVAVTDYKDVDENHYKRKTDASGKAIRERDGNFDYNVYLDTQGNEYHHVTTSDLLASNKTKTFAKGSSLANALTNYKANKQAVMIDGILATAGHPYMIHPAIGVNDGGTTKKNCDFAGITWKPQTQWPAIFERNSRTIDLGVAKNNTILPDSNYNQSAYTAYAGQKYYFIGNAKQYVDGAQTAIGDEPQVPEKPVRQTKPANPPTPPTEPEKSAPNPVITDPETNPAYTDNFKELFTTVRMTVSGWNGITTVSNVPITYGEDLVNCDFSEFFTNYNGYAYATGTTAHNGFSTINFNAAGLSLFKTYLGDNPIPNNIVTLFGDLKTLAQNYANDQSNYAGYAADYAEYLASKKEWDDYRAALDEYNNWDQDAKDEEYTQLLNAYNQAVTAHTEWENNAKSYRVQIPKNAYFLGRRPGAYPKYYRQKAEESYGGTRTTGLWPQFTAIIKVNQAAVDGIEAKLDSNAALSKGFDMAFNTDFDGEILEIDDEGIATIIEEASQEGEPQVDYYDIVVNINGQVVRRGTTSFEGLPKGLYIVNGKKYFVK